MRPTVLTGFVLGLGLATGAAACPTYSQPGVTDHLTGSLLSMPLSFSVMASGETDLRSCPQPGVGYVDTVPDFTFYLSGMDPYYLVAKVVASCDPTLLINTADAQWVFDDDSNGNGNPVIELRRPQAIDGRVDIWVGSYGGQSCDATLMLETFAADGSGGETAGTSPSGCPDPAIAGPSFSVTGQELTTRRSMRVTASGDTALSSCGFTGRGFVNATPTLSLLLSDMAGYDLVLDVESECDSNLLVNTPSGQWLFDDDSAGHLDPRLTVPGGQDGRVDIWLGTYGGISCAGSFFMETRATGGGGGSTATGGSTETPPLLDRISVMSATYGANCGAPQGNVTSHIAAQCDGEDSCDYRVDYTVIGDPAVGCRKEYDVTYHCGDGVARTAHAGAEAGLGSIVTLQCAATGASPTGGGSPAPAPAPALPRYELVVVPGGVSFAAAQQRAQDMGGHLATIASYAELQQAWAVASDPRAWIIYSSGNSLGPWLGGRQTASGQGASEGWTWVTGEPWGYTAWAAGEPSNSNGAETHLHFFAPGSQPGPTWNDIAPDTRLNGFVLER